MTRIDQIAPFIEAMSDDTFENFLAAAAQAIRKNTVYSTLSAEEKAKIDDALDRLDRGEGIPYSDVKARLDAKLKAAGA
jgi:hypothetical protein